MAAPSTSSRVAAASPDESVRRSGRAAALPPDERRAAIISATLPLVMQHGASVSTRQIAESAGIAEGTIFRVFPDKDTLIKAVIEAALDPSAAEAAIQQIDASIDLRGRLTAAVEIIQRRLNDVWRLFSAVGYDNVKNSGEQRRPRDIKGLSELIEPDAHLLDRDAAATARILYAMTLAMSHPMLTADEPASPVEIVSILLDGIRSDRDGGTRRRTATNTKMSHHDVHAHDIPRTNNTGTSC